MVPSLHDVLVEYADDQQPDGRGWAVIQPFQEGGRHYRRVGDFAISYGGALTAKTKAMLAAIEAALAAA